MQSRTRWLFALVALCALTFGVSACGSDDESSSSSGGTGIPEEFVGPTEPSSDATEGGDLKVIAAGDVDYIDPGASYYQFTYMINNAGHRQLLTWGPEDVEEPTPDGAEDYPEISDDAKTLTFTIREGMMFAPPVDREITAADYEYAIERALLPGVANGYQRAYLADITGYEAASKEAEDNPTDGAPDIEGVTAVDDQTLEIQLDEPSAFVVEQTMSLSISAPVPEEYATEFDAENPSTYGENVVYSGPYMVENDADGKLTGYTPNRVISMIRNPNWDPETDDRPAYVDTIEVQEGFEDAASATRKVVAGEASISGDFVPPPDALKDVAENAEEGQLAITPSGGNRYIGLNTTLPPFDNLDVRKAVIAIADREALRNTRGGELSGAVASHLIPPEFPGFEEAGGLEGDTDLDYLENPNGDPELAAEYMKAAGFESGKCDGDDCQITMVGDDIAPGKDTAEVFRSNLEELGFDVTFRPVDHAIMYTRFCSVPDQQPEICPNVGWLKDFNDPQSLLQVTFSGDAIDPENNSNWAQLDDAEINQSIADAVTINDPQERLDAWGQIDQDIMAQAPVVPWIWDNQPNVRSTDVDGVINKFNASWDLSYTSITGG
ncbi:MAG: ABC transporter substrate-binding protein [Solirubrobacterales bacterium]